MDIKFKGDTLKLHVKKAQIEKGLTIKEVISEIGITDASYYNYVTGKNSPDLVTLVKIANYFKLPTDAFIDRGAYGSTTNSNGISSDEVSVDIAQAYLKRIRDLEDDVESLTRSLVLAAQRLGGSQFPVPSKGRGVNQSGVSHPTLFGWNGLAPMYAIC
jgi:transcriptional regulator with XRE-family HTH domain